MLWEALRLAVQTISRNALRSFLTVLGVVIGVAAVIAMVTVGEGSTQRVTSDVSNLGANLLVIRPGQPQRGPGSTSATAAPFSLRDVDAVERDIASVRVAAPAGNRMMTAVVGALNRSTTVTGADNRYLDAREIEVADGRDFHDAETRTGAAVCILGGTVRRELFGAGDPLGQTIRLKGIACKVIGVAEDLGASSFGTDQDDFVIMPMRTFQRRVAGNTDVGLIYAAIRPGIDTERAKGEIERLMRERRRIGPGEEDDFNVFDLKQIASVLTGITAVLTGLLSAVAAISLVVGGIGIMNIMLVSVTERTREIGIRLAIGATAGQVLTQFLIEAVVLSVAGGLIGIVLGLGLGAVGAQALRVPFAPNLWVILMAFGFSAAVGVLFGFVPARRAARMNPIDALRHQ